MHKAARRGWACPGTPLPPPLGLVDRPDCAAVMVAAVGVLLVSVTTTTPLGRALASQSCCRTCNPAPDLVL